MSRAGRVLWGVGVLVWLCACGSGGGVVPVETTLVMGDEAIKAMDTEDELTAAQVHQGVLARLQDMRDFQLLDPLAVDPKLDEVAGRLASQTSAKYGGKPVSDLRPVIRESLTPEEGYGTLSIESRATPDPAKVALPGTVTSKKLARVGLGVHKHTLEGGRVVWKILILMAP